MHAASVHCIELLLRSSYFADLTDLWLHSRRLRPKLLVLAHFMFAPRCSCEHFRVLFDNRHDSEGMLVAASPNGMVVVS